MAVVAIPNEANEFSPNRFELVQAEGKETERGNRKNVQLEWVTGSEVDENDGKYASMVIESVE